MGVFDTDLCAITLPHDVAIENRESFQKHGVKMVAVFSDSQTAIPQTAHMQPDPGQ